MENREVPPLATTPGGGMSVTCPFAGLAALAYTTRPVLLPPVGSPTFLLTKNSWLRVREYSPSTVPTRFHGSWRSKASDARSGCGNLRSLASRFTSPIGLVP